MKKDRIELFDILRGFAMLGVVLMNFHEMNLLPHQNIILPNTLFSNLIYFTFFNRSYLIFAFLFGCSLHLLTKNKIDKFSQTIINKIIFKRLKMILIFGFIQTTCIWFGTILIIYAIYGYFVYYVTKILKDKVQIILYIVILIILPLLLNHISKFDKIILHLSYLPSLETLNNYYISYNPLGIIKLNLFAWLYDYYGISSITTLGEFKQNIIYNCQVLGLIGIGYQIAKKDMLVSLKLIPNIFLLIITIFLYFLITIFEQKTTIDEWFLKNLLFSTGACLFIKLISNNDNIKGWLSPFVIVGQYSFSFYVLHMIISYIVFYVFGLYQKISFYEQEFIAIFSFYILFVVSNYWHNAKKSGPMEILIHKFTYYKITN